MFTINDFAMMEPMRYYDNPEPKTATLRAKRLDIISNKDDLYVASEKHDGDWGMFIHYSKGHNLIRSRSISKVTGVYGDYTAKLPTAVAVMDNWPDNTVILAEICVDGAGNNANTIGTILRCLPEKAVERQKEIKLKFWGFDLLMFGGQDFTSKPYYDRICTLEWFLNDDFVDNPGGAPHFRCTDVYADGWEFESLANEIIVRGGEGLVIQRKDNAYWPGTRTAWKTLKLKQRMDSMELKVVAALDPTKEYTGDDPEHWPYRDVDGKPVTKPYYNGWKSAITVEYGNGTTDVASGLTDDDRAWLATDMAQRMIESGQLYAVIYAMCENDLGRLRHPVFVRFRYPEEM